MAARQRILCRAACWSTASRRLVRICVSTKSAAEHRGWRDRMPRPTRMATSSCRPTVCTTAPRSEPIRSASRGRGHWAAFHPTNATRCPNDCPNVSPTRQRPGSKCKSPAGTTNSIRSILVPERIAKNLVIGPTDRPVLPSRGTFLRASFVRYRKAVADCAVCGPKCRQLD